MSGDGILRGERLHLRPAEDADVPAVLTILAEPEVARWWGGQDAADVAEEVPLAYVVVVDGEVSGWMLVHEEEDPMYRHASLDVVLAARVQGRGLGPEAIRVMVRELARRGHHRVTIDPAAANERAIAAYRRVGFRPVGVLRRYERGPDGQWRDGLLMDLLVDELH